MGRDLTQRRMRRPARRHGGSAAGGRLNADRLSPEQLSGPGPAGVGVLYLLIGNYLPKTRGGSAARVGGRRVDRRNKFRGVPARWAGDCSPGWDRFCWRSASCCQFRCSP